MCNISDNFTDNIDCTTSAAGATILSPVFMFLAGVLGNILALYSLYKTRTDIRTTKFYTLIAGLAWTDLLGIVITSPSVLIAYINGLQWIGGETHCYFHGFAMICFGLATPLIICAMAIERFLALKYVFFYSSRCRRGTARGCVTAMWLGVIVYGLLPLLGFGKYKKQYPGTWCYLDFHSKDIVSKIYGYIYSCTALILIGIIFLCNAYVVITICKTRFKPQTHHYRSESGNAVHHPVPEHEGLVVPRTLRRRSHDVDVQMIVLLCAITIVFTVCWAPLMIQIIVTMATGKANYLLDLTTIRLASLNQTLDPWLYILLRRSLCLRLTKGAGHIKSKCYKAAGLRHREDDNPDQLHVPNNAQNSPLCHLVNNHPNPNSMVELNNGNRLNAPSRDVMQSVEGGHLSPLPDVTHTGTDHNRDSGYVCHFHIGKSVSERQRDGLYVKIFYLQGSSSIKSNATKHSHRRVICDQDDQRQQSCACMQSVSTSGHISDEPRAIPDTKPSESSTKESSVSQDYNETFHSENTTKSSCRRNTHGSLRKTKSSTE